MFDRVIAPPSSKRWRTFLIVGTVGGHAAVLAALVIVAFWKIDKLPVNDDRQITVSVAAETPPPGGPPPGVKLAVVTPPIKPPPDVAVQKTDPVVTPPVTPATGGGSTDTGKKGGGGTNPDGPPDSTEVGTGTCKTPPCGDKPPLVETKKPVVDDKKPFVVVPPNVAAGLRLSGNEKIYPPDSVRVAMMHDGADTLQGTIKLCVDAGGSIESLKLMRSTGYSDYDGELLAAMRGWRYRPYQVNGVATPMCTVEVVIYRMKR